MELSGSKGQEESPELLRDIARRCRTIAGAVPDRDRRRIIAYARELEQMASSLEESKGGCSQAP